MPAEFLGEPSRRHRLEMALAKLRDALEIIDELGDRRAIAARLQEIIDSLGDEDDEISDT